MKNNLNRDMMEKTIKLKIPNVPNFILWEHNASPTIDVAELTEDELKQIGKEWTKALIENSKNRKKLYNNIHPTK